MASIGSSGPPRLAEYDVFLSFRGLDTRTTLADYLYHDLKDAGIRVFRDDEELYKGKELASELPRAISNSRICIPIFSRNYANSAWCLREAAHMVECWEKAKGEVEIVPVFCDVDVSEVKLRSGSYKDDIEKHKARFEEEIIDRWKDALAKMGGLKGWTLNDAKGQGELVKRIVQDLLIKLKIPYRNLPSKVVGLEDVVDALMKLIDVDSEGVKFIVVHGMGGIGKTTLAKVVFNQLVSSYEGCSFLDNVRESAKPDEILGLQKKLLSDVFNPKVAEIIKDTDEGINRIRGQMGSKRVLVVLDNVDEGDQLQSLSGRSDWFGSGSRIIITTRNRGVLAGKGESDKYFYHELEQMGFADALALFSWHAFRKDNPPEDYGDLSRGIVSAMGCLPLALEVIGSLLLCKCYDVCKCKTIWQETFDKLKRMPNKKIQDTLMMSIEKLDFGQRQVFLDVACFFVNVDITNAIYMWRDCDYAPHSAINFLVELSLLKRIDGNKLWMHDLVRDVGREMIREGRHSRLWDSQEAINIIKGKRGTDVIEVLMLKNYECTITLDATSNMENLRFLTIRGANLKGDFMDHLPNLRWLNWYDTPSTFKAVNFHPRNLVVLKLRSRSITKSWGGWKELKVACKLKVLDLTGCSWLTKTPDFSSFLQLEKLILKSCYMLAELDPSICKLKHLAHLNMQFCQSLRRLPENIGSLSFLEYLCLAGCEKLQELPSSIGDLKSLEYLWLAGCKKLRELPSSIGDLKSLEYLCLAGCKKLWELPSSIGDLKSLVELDLSFLGNLHQLPDSIGNLESLKVIKLEATVIRKLPTSIGLLQNLEVMDAQYSCKLEVEFPMGMEGLPLLKILNFEFTTVHFPKSLTGLSHLEELNFGLPYEFDVLQFPELPSSLKSLKINANFSVDFPPDLSYLTNLTNLVLSRLSSSRISLWWIAQLSKLESMTIGSYGTVTLPQELANLSMLKHISLYDGMLQCLPGLPSRLETLKLSQLEASYSLEETIPCLKDLQILHSLEIIYCKFSNLDGLHFLSSLRKLSIFGYYNGVLDLSGLKKLKSLHLSTCKALVEIQGLGDLILLEELTVRACDYLEGIYGLSNLRNLKHLRVFDCPRLTIIQALDQLPALSKLALEGSGSLGLDVSKLDIKYLYVSGCPNVSQHRWSRMIMSYPERMRDRFLQLLFSFFFKLKYA